jgi:hypothetical protein
MATPLREDLTHTGDDAVPSLAERISAGALQTPAGFLFARTPKAGLIEQEGGFGFWRRP